MKRHLLDILGALLIISSLVFMHSGATFLSEEAPLASLIDGLLAILLICGGSALGGAEPQETP